MKRTLNINKSLLLEAYSTGQNLAQGAGVLGGAALGAGAAAVTDNMDVLSMAGGAGAALGGLGTGAYLATQTPEGQALNAQLNRTHNADLAKARAQGTINPIANAIYK